MNIKGLLTTYAVFMGFLLLVNLSMELLIPTPEEKNAIGIIIFYLIFSLPGAALLLYKKCRPLMMGILSLALGFFFEFAFMKPDWVMQLYALRFTGDALGAVVVSAFYWFIAWGAPAYLHGRFLEK